MTTATMEATADRTVIIATAGLDDEAAASAQQACARLSARPLLWGGEANQPAPTLTENSVVTVLAALPPGERQIPERLVRLATHDWPGASILLLCRESLVRPSVSLQNGRVTLVEPPFSVRRIASRLRVIFADSTEGPRRDLGQTGAVLREHQRAGYWMGALLAGSKSAVPWYDHRQTLTALVPAGEAAPAPDRLARAAEVLVRGGEPDAMAAALTELGVTDGLVHLDAAGEEWIVFWPLVDRPLWLCSAQRLPPSWDLAATARESASRCVRVPAASGDIVLTLPSPPPEWAPNRAASAGVSAELPGELTDALADGGPAVLEVLEARLRGRRSPFTLVIETR
jgi:hypothetical protein